VGYVENGPTLAVIDGKGWALSRTMRRQMGWNIFAPSVALRKAKSHHCPLEE